MKTQRAERAGTDTGGRKARKQIAAKVMASLFTVGSMPGSSPAARVTVTTVRHGGGLTFTRWAERIPHAVHGAGRW